MEECCEMLFDEPNLLLLEYVIFFASGWLTGCAYRIAKKKHKRDHKNNHVS